MNKKKVLLRIITSLTMVILVWAFLDLTGFIPSPGVWYSHDPALRLQTDAFQRGELAVQPVPYRHLHDWAWGNGLHQVWGLGVPFMQLPFQLLGKAVNGFGFPDRLIFLFFYILTATLFWRAMEEGFPLKNSRERLQHRLLYLPLLLYAFLNHALINMIQGKFEAYEEVIAYGYLWSLMLFALLYMFLHRRNRYLFVLICLASGFAMNIRPTLGAYGLVTFLIAFCLAWRGKTKTSWAGPLLFLLGLGLYLSMNYLRFGSPLEAGHKLGLSDDPYSNFVVKFNNPMDMLPFRSAALELISAMFFLSLAKSYNNGELFWKATDLRIRELNFTPYYLIELIIVLLSWAMVFVVLRQFKREKFISGEATAPDPSILAISVAWSFFSFAQLTVFYARWPGILSRYMVDFGPAIVVSVGTIYYYLVWSYRKLLARLAVWAALSGWTVFSLCYGEVYTSYYFNPVTVNNLTSARQRHLDSRTTTGPPLPEQYSCGTDGSYDIPYNHVGWRISVDCSLAIATMHFFDNPDCLELNMVPNNYQMTGKEYSDREIEVLLGAKPMHRVAEETSVEGKVVTFCRADGSGEQSSRYSTIKLINIRWFEWNAHPYSETIPYVMTKLSKVARKPDWR